MARRKNYLNNSDLLVQLRLSHDEGNMTPELGQMFLTLVTRFQSKSSWCNYPKQVKDEFMSNALCDLCEAWFKFSEEKSQNPFAYFTTVVSNSFRKTIIKEKNYMNFKTFLRQSVDDTTVASYAQHMGKHEGVNRYVNDEKYLETDDE